jgi:hypothetical protein
MEYGHANLTNTVDTCRQGAERKKGDTEFHGRCFLRKKAAESKQVLRTKRFVVKGKSACQLGWKSSGIVRGQRILENLCRVPPCRMGQLASPTLRGTS